MCVMKSIVKIQKPKVENRREKIYVPPEGSWPRFKAGLKDCAFMGGCQPCHNERTRKEKTGFHLVLGRRGGHYCPSHFCVSAW